MEKKTLYATFSHYKNHLFWSKLGCATFWAMFSQTHFVTLFMTVSKNIVTLWQEWEQITLLSTKLLRRKGINFLRSYLLRREETAFCLWDFRIDFWYEIPERASALAFCELSMETVALCTCMQPDSFPSFQTICLYTLFQYFLGYITTKKLITKSTHWLVLIEPGGNLTTYEFTTTTPTM
jgi:hypothetical protein